MSKVLNRRQLLKAGLASAVVAPLLGSLSGRSFAGPPTFPKRLVVMFSANGTIPPAWAPSGTETNFTLGPILSPLDPYKSSLLVLDNVGMESAYHGPGDGHQTGMGHMLTGTELLDGTLFQGGGGAGTVGWGGGISIDQQIANTVGANTKFSSLEFGVLVDGASVWSRMAYAGSNQPIPPENDPGQAYTRIFGSLSGDPLGLAKLLAQRKSVLDAVGADFDALNKRVSSEDRVKLDAHVSAIRDVEKRLGNGGLLGGACKKPSTPGAIDLNSDANLPAIGKLQMDMLVMSLACDLTRVASIQWSNSVSGIVFSGLGITTGHHELSHMGDSDVAAQDALTKINNFYAQQLAYLLGAMKAIPEGTGTMLDNTVVLWCNELGVGNTHTRRGIPWVLAGSAGGALKTGRFLTYPDGTMHNDLLVSLANAMDVPITTFGNPAYCNGPLPNLI